jgi:thioesterase domain-containing protein
MGVANRHLILAEEELRDRGEAELLSLLFEEARRQGALPPETERGDFDAFFRVFKGNLDALSRYTPSGYRGKLTLLRAAQAASADLPETWRRATSGEVIVRDVPGDHYTMLREPALDVVVGELVPLFCATVPATSTVALYAESAGA